MERPNQPPKTEGCSEAQGTVDLWFFRTKRRQRSVPPGTREPQAGVASGLSHSAPKQPYADGDGVAVPESNIPVAAQGEAARSLPGSESVARAEGNARNWGGPENSGRTNSERQAGKAPQRQEAGSEDPQGVGGTHSTGLQGASLEAREGVHTLAQPAQATSPERRSEPDWPTFLRAIAEKAQRQLHDRFRDLYRQLNETVLRLCFFQLRKDAASGVDGINFQE
jgi:hypothetical protein